MGVKLARGPRAELGESCQDPEKIIQRPALPASSPGSIQRLNVTVGLGALVLCGICSSSNFLWRGGSLFYFHLDNLCGSFIILLLVVSILFFKFQSFSLNVVRCQDLVGCQRSLDNYPIHKARFQLKTCVLNSLHSLWLSIHLVDNQYSQGGIWLKFL